MSREPNRRGAPAGNRNALKTGCHTAEMRAFRAKYAPICVKPGPCWPGAGSSAACAAPVSIP